MAFDYINEAFKRLDLLEEQMFDTSLNGINELSDFMDGDNVDEIVRVIDPEAYEEEELQDSYVGKVIINCNVCHSHIFENKEEIKIEEDGAVNIENQCPYCGEQEGFTIVGEIAPYGEPKVEVEGENVEEEPTSEIPAEDPINVDLEESLLGTAVAAAAGKVVGDAISNRLSEDSDCEDMSENKSVRMSRATKRAMQEDFKEVSITTEDQHMEMTSDENGKVTVTTEPITTMSSEEEMIVPVSDETEQDILNNNELEPTSEESSEEASENVGDEFDLDFEDVDEEGMNELGESYLRKVYENVDSFKTTSVAANSQALIVEGVITFNSGMRKKTGFVFEAKDINSKNKLRFSGSNKHLTESNDAFSLVGYIDNKKLFVESLKYNYNVNNERIRGIVRRK